MRQSALAPQPRPSALLTAALARPAAARVLAAVVVTTSLVAACASGADTPAARARPGTTTTTVAAPTTTTTGPPADLTASRFTTTGDRAGFAHGFELIRRIPPADVERDLDEMAGTGARWLRASIDWGHIESAPGVYDWTGTDRVVLGGLRRGMSVIGVITYAPGWAAHPGCRGECAPRDPAEYAAFARVAADRYAPLGLSHWEIWNEPNHAVFWSPRPDPAAYVDALERASTEIHAVDPRAVVMTGGLSPAPDAGAEISPLTFLRKVYELGGASAFEAVATHPYQFPNPPTSTEPTNAFLQTLKLHDVMVDNGDGAKQIWGTEVGAPTRGFHSISESQQAQWLRQYYDAWNGWAFTGPLLWYSFRDKATGSDIEDAYGLVHTDRSPKPAFHEFVDMIRSAPKVSRTPGASERAQGAGTANGSRAISE